MKALLVVFLILTNVITFAMAEEDVSMSYSLVRDATLGQGEQSIDSIVGIWKEFGSIAPASCIDVSHDAIVTINRGYSSDFITIEKTQSGNYIVTDDYYHKKFEGNPTGSSALDFNVYFSSYSLGTFKVGEDIYLAKSQNQQYFYCTNLFIYKKY